MRPVTGILPAALVGGLALTCGVALTTTSGWLIVAASHRPQILTLLGAIVLVPVRAADQVHHLVAFDRAGAREHRVRADAGQVVDPGCP